MKTTSATLRRNEWMATTSCLSPIAEKTTVEVPLVEALKLHCFFYFSRHRSGWQAQISLLVDKRNPDIGVIFQIPNHYLVIS